jgi:hypothetical protein
MSDSIRLRKAATPRGPTCAYAGRGIRSCSVRNPVVGPDASSDTATSLAAGRFEEFGLEVRSARSPADARSVRQENGALVWVAAERTQPCPQARCYRSSILTNLSRWPIANDSRRASHAGSPSCSSAGQDQTELPPSRNSQGTRWPAPGELAILVLPSYSSFGRVARYHVSPRQPTVSVSIGPQGLMSGPDSLPPAQAFPGRRLTIVEILP